jgi:hypothetical protein
MKRSILVSVVAVLSSLALRAPADEPLAKSVRLWNPATVTTVSGTVEAVERLEMGGSWSCVRLRLRTAEGTLTVRVGPDWFIAERGYAFAAGEQVEIKGSRVRFAGEPALVAGEIRRGGERIVLRDASGKAAWAAKP